MSDMNNRLVFIMPEEKQEQVRNVVKAMFPNDDVIIDDMLVDEYEHAIKERDELAEKLRCVPVDVNVEIVNLRDRLNLCERDKDILVSELNERTKNVAQKYNEMLTQLKIFLSEEDFRSFMKDFTESEIAMYNLEEFKEEKYKIIELEVTREIKKNIKVLVKENDTAKDAIEVLEEYENYSNLDDYIDESDDVEYSYSEYDSSENTYTKEQVLRHSEQYWCSDDVMREIYE